MIETAYRILDLAEKTESLSKTAEILHLTPSAASKSLRKLEKELGVQLLSRSSDGVKLTNDGASILPFIRMALNAEFRAEEELDRIRENHRGSLRIGTFSSVGCNWIPDIVNRMAQSYPQIELKIRQGGYDDLVALLDAGELDVVFASIPTDGNFPTYPLLKDRLLCITPESFVPDNPACVTIEEIRAQTFILPCEGNDYDAVAFLNANHLKVNNPHYVADDAVIVAMVEAGLGVSIMPELVLEKITGKIGIYPVESAPVRVIGLATQRTEYVTKTAKDFIRIVQQYVRERYAENLSYFR